MSDNSTKFYPSSSAEIAEMLGLKRENSPLPGDNLTMVVPSGVPILEVPKPSRVVAVETTESTEKVAHGDLEVTVVKKRSRIVSVIAGVLPYMAVFAIGVLVYYFYFADPSSRPQVAQKTQEQIQEEAKQAKKNALIAYQNNQIKNYTTWINQFYFSVSDSTITNPDTVSANGLTNFENYMLNLNPKMYDELGNGKSGAENVLAGVYPKTGELLNDTQIDLVAKYFDKDDIQKRVAGIRSNTNNEGRVAGTQILIRGPAVNSVPLPTPTNFLQPEAPEKPKNNTSLSVPVAQGTYNINTAIPGRLEVPTIGVNVPIIWTTDPKNFDQDLKTGVVHYPGTPLPGDVGTSYISGHSSNYAWVKADFNRVFSKMNELPDGASFKITVVNKEGKDVRLHYRVEHKLEFKADDQEQFINYAYSRVALSTCWPINTTSRRLVAFGRLVNVD